MVKEIQLTQGKVALVDDADYEWLNKLKWHAIKDKWNWYANHVDGHTNIRMHVLILQTPKGMQSDHKDGNGLNNQRNNLRICTSSENTQNSRVRNQSKYSQFKGVSWHKYKNKWVAGIKINGVRREIGAFHNEIDAALAYDKEAEELFGEFARLNFKEVANV